MKFLKLQTCNLEYFYRFKNSFEPTPKNLCVVQAHPHPAKTEKAQPFEITPSSIIMVPKPGFEPGQAYTH